MMLTCIMASLDTPELALLMVAEGFLW